MSVEVLAIAHGAILYDTARTDRPSEDWFSPDYWVARHKVAARGGGRGSVLFIRDDTRYWVLRHYLRGGLIAKLLRDSYVWTGLERTRAFREWRLLHAMRAEGLPVPVPVAARVIRSGWFYRADLITEALPAARPLSDAITGAVLQDDVWRKVGAAIAKFHRAGVHHADLNAHNILLGESAKVFLLDFDRGEKRTRGAWEQAVLSRLQRSLNKIKSQRTNVGFGEREWAALLEGYESFETPAARRETR
jgi:3-deoxy-D-manno-octulosonic acid kinase